MEIDIEKLEYLEDPVNSKQIECIIEGIKKSWADCIEKDSQIFDCKILQARWVTNKSALNLSEYCDEDNFDTTPLNVIEAKYSIWISSDDSFDPEIIKCITNTIYLYKYPDDAEYPYTISFIHETEHSEFEGGIESTGLPEEGILELLEKLEYYYSDFDSSEMEIERVQDDVHPRVKELPKRLQDKARKEDLEFERKEKLRAQEKKLKKCRIYGNLFP
ncbi:MAG: hypothetical protein WCR13_06285 [Sphaerochaeta sp.]